MISADLPPLCKSGIFKKILTAGLVLTSGATFLLARSTQAWQLIACGALRGVGCAFLGLVLITMILNQWFAKNLGLATSFVFGASGLVGSIGSYLLNLVNEQWGWQTGFNVMGVAIIVLSLPAILYPYTMNPANCGCVAYGAEEGRTETESAKSSQKKIRFGSFAFLSIFVISIASNICTSLPQHFPGYAESLGFTAAVGALLLSFNMAFNIIGKIIGGQLEKKIGSVFTGLTCLALSFAGMALVLQGGSSLTLKLGSMLYGFIYVLSTISLVTLTKANFGRENYAKYYPIIQFAGGFTNALALPAVGYLYDFTGSYKPAFFIAEGLIILMAVILIVIQKNKGSIHSAR